MMKDLKLAFHMIKFGYGIKTNLILCAVMLILGFTVELLSRGINWIGGFFIIGSVMYGVQFLYCASLSDLVLSSPYRKRLQTTMPTMVNLVMNLLVFTVLIVSRMIWIFIYPEKRVEILWGLFFVALMSVLLSAYIGIAFKYFVASMLIICFISGVFGAANNILRITTEETEIMRDLWLFQPAAAIVTVYLMILAGAGLQYVISLAIHKKPLSKRAQGAAMKRYL